EAADTQATENVRAFRPRHELLTLRQQWDELTKTTTELPGLEADLAKAVNGHRLAKQATETAEQHTEQLRAAAERAAGTANQAQQAVPSATEQLTTLAAITVPDDLGDLITALNALRTRHADLDAEAAAAEDAYRAAQAALARAPSETIVSTGLRTATTLHDDLTEDLSEWDNRHRAASALAAAAADADDAAQALTAARAALNAARLADEAGTLRARLLPGQPCPVCEQPVKAVPAGHDTSHVAAAEKEVASAQAHSDRAAAKPPRLARDHRATATTRAGTLRHVETARAELRIALRNLSGAGADLADADARSQNATSLATAPGEPGL